MFDWVTWGLFAIGLLILVAWLILPIREFKNLMRKRTKEKTDRAD